MSVSLKQSYDVEYDGVHNVARMDIYIDDASDLIGLDDIDDIYFLQGSDALDISTGDHYLRNSSGSWILQPSAQYPDAYTKTQTDGLLSAHVCTCDTAGNVADKVATTTDDFVLREGTIIVVKFANNNTISDTSGHPITLNVNDTGKFRISFGGGAYTNNNETRIFGFANYYTYYVFINNRWVWLGFAWEEIIYNLSQAEASQGTSTTRRYIQAKVLHDTILEQTTPLQSALTDIINSGGKNTMKYTLTDLQTQNTGGGYGFTWADNVCTSSRGVVFTVNSDMSIRVQSTNASGDVWFLLENHGYTIGDWIMSGCPADGSTSKYYMESDNENARDIGSGVQITAASDFSDNIYIVVKSGQTFDLTFKPMICDKSLYDVSQTYEPYCPTLAELYALVRSYHP